MAAPSSSPKAEKGFADFAATVPTGIQLEICSKVIRCSLASLLTALPYSCLQRRGQQTVYRNMVKAILKLLIFSTRLPAEEGVRDQRGLTERGCSAATDSTILFNC